MKKGEAVFIISIIVSAVFYGVSSLMLNIGVASRKKDRIVTDEYEISIEIIEPIKNRVGTIVLIHGILSSKNMLRPYATDLVRYGWRVILVDQLGHGETGSKYRLTMDDIDDPAYALEKIINQSNSFRKALGAYLRSKLGEEKIAFGGHSMGALLALLMAKEYDDDLNIVATIAIAPPYLEGIVNRTVPRNILLCLGKYDEFITINDLKSYVNPDMPEVVEVGRTYGNFTRGDARMVFISPSSDHIFEPYDPLIIEQSIIWLSRSVGMSYSHVVVLATLASALKALSTLVGLILVAMLPIVLADKIGMISGGKRFPTLKLIKNTLAAAYVTWPLVTIFFLLMLLRHIIELAGMLGYIMPVLIGGYLLVATIGLIVASSFLSGGEVVGVIKKVYLYIRSDPIRGMFLGLAEAVVFLLVLELTLGEVFMPMIPKSPGRIGMAILLGLMIFGYFIFHEYLFRAQIQEIYGGKKRRAAIISIGISLSSKIVVIIAIAGIVYVISPFSIVAVAGIFGMVLVALLTEGLAATSYYATREILPHALASAIVWASIAAAAFPVVIITL